MLMMYFITMNINVNETIKHNKVMSL